MLWENLLNWGWQSAKKESFNALLEMRNSNDKNYAYGNKVKRRDKKKIMSKSLSIKTLGSVCEPKLELER